MPGIHEASMASCNCTQYKMNKQMPTLIRESCFLASAEDREHKQVW